MEVIMIFFFRFGDKLVSLVHDKEADEFLMGISVSKEWIVMIVCLFNEMWFGWKSAKASNYMLLEFNDVWSDGTEK